MRPVDCCLAGGFDESKFVEFIVPSLARNGEEELQAYVSRKM